MSYARSPRPVCSTTIGTRLLTLRLSRAHIFAFFYARSFFGFCAAQKKIQRLPPTHRLSQPLAILFLSIELRRPIAFPPRLRHDLADPRPQLLIIDLDLLLLRKRIDDKPGPGALLGPSLQLLRRVLDPLARLLMRQPARFERLMPLRFHRTQLARHHRLRQLHRIPLHYQRSPP